MYGKPNRNVIPSDNEARQKLAMYVYEYLFHIGAEKAAQTFLHEIRWNKHIQVGEPPGFLHSWWCVFWDLYCASPEKRDTCEHSNEAKAFHEYSASAGPLSSMPLDGMGQPAGMPSSFYSHYNSRFSGPTPSRSGLQGPGGPQNVFQGLDHIARGQMMTMNRMPHPRPLTPGGMNPYASEHFQPGYSGGIRAPATSMTGHSGMPMSSMHPRSPWTNPSSGPSSVGPPSTPMMRSPPDQMSSEYAPISKPLQQQPMFGMSGSGPDSIPSTSLPIPTGPSSLSASGPIAPSLNGMNGGVPEQTLLDRMSKNSPNSMPMGIINSNGPPAMAPPGGPVGTPHTPQDGDGDAFGMVSFSDNDQNDTAAILQIKESMQQEVKRFESIEGDVGGGPTSKTFGFMP